MIRRFLRSVKYALQGIRIGVTEERNMRIDIVAMLFVWYHIRFFNLTRGETALVVLITFLIPAFELMNTAVERAVHKPDAEHWMPAGDAKDAAAGAVFIATLGAVAVAAMLFLNKEGVVNLIAYYTANIIRPLKLIVFIIAGYFFITYDNFIKKEK